MLVMVSLAFHLFVDTLFLLCALMAATNVVNVVVHSFVADSSLLAVVIWWCFFHLMFAGRPPFAFLRWKLCTNPSDLTAFDYADIV